MALLSRDRGGIRGPLFASLFTVLLLISAVYIYLLFIETTPERQRTWSENRPSLYPAVGSAPPAYGLFGFPYQAGWRAVANLPLIGPYASNEEMEITAYYLAQAPRTHCPNFATFILAENVQDVVPYDPAWLAGLHLHYRITVNGRPTLAVYSQQPAPFVSSIEASRQHLWRTPAAVAPPSYRGAHLVGLTLGQQARLLGYDLDTREAYAGGQVTVTLYWQALAPFDNNYQVFTHLYDGQMWGQHDGAPECALNPTTRWEPGQIIADPHIIPIEPGAPAGPVPLLVGMYDLLSKERLAVPGTADNVIHLADVWLRQK
jgi:hypothetical protein